MARGSRFQQKSEDEDNQGMDTFNSAPDDGYFDLPDQWINTSCYGRDKTRANVQLPTLPKIFQTQESYVTRADSSVFNMNVLPHSERFDQDALSSKKAVGRGHMLKVHQSANQSGKVGKIASEETPFGHTLHESGAFKNCPIVNSSALLFSEREPGTFFPKSKSALLDTYKPECLEDFPALSNSSGPKMSSVSSPKAGSKKKKKSKKTVDNEVQPELSLKSISDIALQDFSNAEETSPAMQSFTEYEESSAAGSVSKDFTDTSLSSLMGDIDMLTPESDRKQTSGGAINFDDIDDVDLNSSASASQDSGKNKGADQQNGEKMSASGSKKDCDSSNSLPAKSKGWKLEGPLVVQMDNVPENRTDILMKYMEDMFQSYYVESEKKKGKKKMNSWRFRFLTDKDCEYAVDCFHQNDAVHAGVSCTRLKATEEDEGTPV